MNPIRYGSVTPRPHRHAWVVSATATSCATCGKQDDGSAKRGKNNRSRGNRIELEIARALGLRKVGMYGGPEDAGDRDSPFLVQVKSRSGSAFPGWMDDELAKLPVTSVQTPLLAIAEAGVIGKRRRTLIVLRLEDWRALHESTSDLG